MYIVAVNGYRYAIDFTPGKVELRNGDIVDGVNCSVTSVERGSGFSMGAPGRNNKTPEERAFWIPAKEIEKIDGLATAEELWSALLERMKVSDNNDVLVEDDFDIDGVFCGLAVYANRGLRDTIASVDGVKGVLTGDPEDTMYVAWLYPNCDVDAIKRNIEAAIRAYSK